MNYSCPDCQVQMLRVTPPALADWPAAAIAEHVCPRCAWAFFEDVEEGPVWQVEIDLLDDGHGIGHDWLPSVEGEEELRRRTVIVRQWSPIQRFVEVTRRLGPTVVAECRLFGASKPPSTPKLAEK